MRPKGGAAVQGIANITMERPVKIHLKMNETTLRKDHPCDFDALGSLIAV